MGIAALVRWRLGPRAPSAAEERIEGRTRVVRGLGVGVTTLLEDLRFFVGRRGCGEPRGDLLERAGPMRRGRFLRGSPTGFLEDLRFFVGRRWRGEP